MKYVLGTMVGLLSLIFFILAFGLSNFIFYIPSVLVIASSSIGYFTKFDGGLRESLMGKDFDYEEAHRKNIEKYKNS